MSAELDARCGFKVDCRDHVSGFFAVFVGIVVADIAVFFNDVLIYHDAAHIIVYAFIFVNSVFA